MRPFFLLVVATCTCSFVACRELSLNYSLVSIEAEGEVYPATKDQVESIRQGIGSLINRSVIPALTGYGGACGCGGYGWRRAAYLNMSDPTQTCPPAWELIATPRRSCARPSNATGRTCYAVTFPTQDFQYSQICGKFIGYQVGHPEATRVLGIILCAVVFCTCCHALQKIKVNLTQWHVGYVSCVTPFSIIKRWNYSYLLGRHFKS